MRKIFLVLFFLLAFTSVGQGQVLTLDSPEILAVPTATKLNLKQINIDIANNMVEVIYRFVDLEGRDIPITGISGSLDRRWVCRDIPAQLAENCTGVGEPYVGCTGVGTGTGLNPGSTCFKDTFSFVIRTQDAGTPIGKGLRALIWNKMRKDVLTGTNNAVLP